ncbi:MAG: MarR family transcriptional regulator [Deltaproteobacteria bacterium]|nr:MarR family transcriptional regulator [Deltaproteobacteria bacterium]MBI2500649.1 MarR family transcriptional regulator [Deltaproteobacteria bacterium]MBI4196720.1 MarR family transcriptional regulator [Deltaproteobacteria bacterium]
MPLQLISKGSSKKKTAKNLPEVRDSLIESAGKISANMLGMVSRVGGQIYSLLFLSRNPLSLDQISEQLRLSKGNISVNVRMLEEAGLVRKVWVKGDRRDFYEAHRDYPRKLLKEFFDRVRKGIEDSTRVINRCQTELEEASAGLKGEEAEDALFMKLQLELLLAFYGAASRIFDDFYQGREVDTDLLRKAILE